MNEEREQLPPDEPPESPVDPAVLEAARAAIIARGGQARMMTVMSYPAPLLNDLLEKLVDHRNRTDQTMDWLSIEVAGREQLEMPSKSAFYRFAGLVREEYRLALLADRRRAAETYVAQATAGNPDAQQMALNTRMTELLTDELLRAGDAGQIETKRLMALMVGARTVAQTAFDKQKMDVRIEALHKQIEHRQITIDLLEQRLAKLPDQVKAVEEKLAKVEQAQSQGKKVDASIYAAIRAELTKMAAPTAAKVVSEPGAAIEVTEVPMPSGVQSAISAALKGGA